jgi:hypothetical protein
MVVADDRLEDAAENIPPQSIVPELDGVSPRLGRRESTMPVSLYPNTLYRFRSLNVYTLAASYKDNKRSLKI